MSFSLLSVAILLLFVAVWVIEIMGCIKKGFRRSLISLASVICAILISLLLCPAVASAVTEATFEGWIGDIGILEDASKDLYHIDHFLIAIISILISTILFVFVFFAVHGSINTIVNKIYKARSATAIPMDKLTEKHSYIDKHDKSLSVITGSVIAVIVTMVITAPIMGTLDVADRVLDIGQKTDKIFPSTVPDEMAESVDLYSKDAVGNVFYQLGGKLIYSGSANCRMYDERVYLMSELEVLDKTVDDFLRVYDIFNNKRGETNIKTYHLYALGEDIEQLRMLRGVFAQGLSDGASAWLNGHEYMSILKPETNSLIEPSFDRILAVCAESDAKSVGLNIKTLLHIYAEILDSGIMELDTGNYDEVLEFIEDSKIVPKLTKILEANPYMNSISVSSIAMAAISDHLLTYNYDSEQYGQLISDIADSINAVYSKGYHSPEERTEALASYTVKHIKGYGVEISDDVAELVASELLDVFSDYEQLVSPEDVDELFASFAK